MTRTDRLSIALMVTGAATLVAYAKTIMALAVWPPRLGLVTALLLPFMHLAERAQQSVLAIVLGPLQWFLYGAYLSAAYVRGTVMRPLAFVLAIHAVAVIGVLIIESSMVK